MILDTFKEAGLNLSAKGDALAVSPRSKLNNDWRDYIVKNKPLILRELNNQVGLGRRPPPSFDVFDSDIYQNPKPELLEAPELEAFEGWENAMIKKMPAKEARLLAWQYLMDSLQNMSRDKRGPWRVD